MCAQLKSKLQYARPTPISWYGGTSPEVINCLFTSNCSEDYPPAMLQLTPIYKLRGGRAKLHQPIRTHQIQAKRSARTLHLT